MHALLDDIISCDLFSLVLIAITTYLVLQTRMSVLVLQWFSPPCTNTVKVRMRKSFVIMPASSEV